MGCELLGRIGLWVFMYVYVYVYVHINMIVNIP
jgi:hypothetical protein